MLKFILNKTVFKTYDKETKNSLYAFLGKKYLIQWICFFIFHLIFIAPMVIICFAACDKEFDNINNIILGSSIFLYGCLLCVFYSYFFEEIFKFITISMPTKLYSSLYTKKGNAIQKEDFNIIKNNNFELYQCVTSSLCHGHCYSICFALLKTLKKGSIKFIAAKKLADENRKSQPYTMHVLYVQNNWAFDTFSQRQYPLDKAISLHKGIVYKNFSYTDIANLSYEEFMEQNCAELDSWCKNHNCYFKWAFKD